MQRILDFLEKFKVVRPPDESVRVNFSQIVGEKLGIAVGVENIKVKNFSIYLSGLNGTEKNEIFIHKRGLLSELKEKIGKELVGDIK